MKKILVVLAVLLLVACAPKSPDVGEGAVSSQNRGSETAEEHEGVVKNDHELNSAGEVKEFEIIARNWEFEPSTIEVNKGDLVELHVMSVEGTHGFALPDFGVSERLIVNRDVHVEFVADKKGTFPFACSVPCGRGHGGMRGQLIVS